MASKQTAAPSGLKVERSGNKFKCTWNQGGDYTSFQNFEWRIKTGKKQKNKKGKTTMNTDTTKWDRMDVGNKQNQKTVTINLNNYYPRTEKYLINFQFRVRGKRKDENKTAHPVSDWKEYIFSLDPPSKPKLTKELLSDREFSTRFTYSLGAVKSNGSNPFEWFEWDTTVVRTGKRSWPKTHNRDTNGGSVTRNEDGFKTGKVKDMTITRWFRVRACGPRGTSGWVTKKQVYAKPLPVKNIKVKSAKSRLLKGITEVGLEWKVNTSKKHPIQFTKIEYYIGTPKVVYIEDDKGNSERYLMPDETDIGWNDCGSQADTKGKDFDNVDIPALVGKDQCLWVRLVPTFNSRTNPSQAYLVRPGTLTKLKEPTITVSPVSSNTFDVNVTNNSDVIGSYVILRFQNSKDETKYNDKILGITAESESSGAQQVVTVNTPTISDPTKVTFTAQTIFNADSITSSKTGNISVYTYTNYKDSRGRIITLKSDSVKDRSDDLDVPVPPENVRLEKIKDGSIQVTWDMNWDSAAGTEISWANHDDAWYATNEPTVYKMDKSRGSKLNINELDFSVPWYIRARFYTQSSGSSGEVNGPYTDILEFNNFKDQSITGLYISSNFANVNDSVQMSMDFQREDKETYICDFALVRDSYRKAVTDGDHVYICEETFVSNGQNPDDEDFNMDFKLSYPVLMPSQGDRREAISVVRLYNSSRNGQSLVSSNHYQLIESSPGVYDTLRFLNPYELPPRGDGIYVFYLYKIRKFGSTYDLKIFDNEEYYTRSLDPETQEYVYTRVNNPVLSDIFDYYVKVTLYSILKKDTGEESEDSDNTENQAPIVSNVYNQTSMDIKISDPLRIDKSICENRPLYYKTPDLDIVEGHMYYIKTATGESPRDNIYVLDEDPTASRISDYYNQVATEEEEVYKGLDIADSLTFEVGSTYYFSGRVRTYSIDKFGDITDQVDSSDWTEQVYLSIADIPECHITSTSLIQKPYTEEGETITRTVLDRMPLFVDIDTEGDIQNVSLVVKKLIDFSTERPSDSSAAGYEGETIFIGDYPNDGSKRITNDDLYNIFKTQFDDSCTYIMRAYATDNYSQVAEDSVEFMVDWDHQAVDPIGTVEYKDNLGYIHVGVPEGGVVEEYFLTEDTTVDNYKIYYTRSLDPTTQEYKYTEVVEPNDEDIGTYYEKNDSDYVNIYRLSADSPELIYRKAPLGSTVIDPYPTIGQHGGYRLVFVTANGDYIANNPKHVAFLDIEGGVNTKFQYINYSGGFIEFKYNVDLDISWNKQFTKTHYLGGSIEGDWDEGVEINGSLAGNTFEDIEVEPDTYLQLRELGNTPDICRIRTIDGSNFTANINVSDSREHNHPGHMHSINLSYDKIDNPFEDGVLEEDWEDEQEGD